MRSRSHPLRGLRRDVKREEEEDKKRAPSEKGRAKPPKAIDLPFYLRSFLVHKQGFSNSSKRVGLKQNQSTSLETLGLTPRYVKSLLCTDSWIAKVSILWPDFSPRVVFLL